MTDRKQRKRIETERNRNKKIMKVEQKRLDGYLQATG